VCTSSCGDSTLDPGEQCDDGNTTAADGCSATCAFEAGYYCSGVPSTCVMVMCGDSTVDPGEQCDDGNTADGDACSGRCALEIAASGSSVMVSGSIDTTDPQWARPGATCGATSPADHYFDMYTIENTTGADQVLTVTAAWAGGDGYLHAYRYPFEPSATDFNCIAGNDDFGGASGSEITGLSIAAGERLVVVASTFSGSAAIGTYDITIATD
jgi:cysteine-rich repeat protein